MKNLIFGFVLLSGMAHAENLTVTVKDFNFNYKNPQGSGSASSFTRSSVLNKEAVQVSVDKVGDVFKLGVTGAETHDFEFKGAPSFMTEAETMNVTGFNLSLTDRLVLSMTQGRFNSAKDELKLDGVNLDCARDGKSEEAMDQLINGCIQKMTLKSSKFSSSSEENMMGIFAQSISKAVDERLGIDAVGVNSLDLRTTAGNYDLSADVKAQISGKVRSKGFMSYEEKSGKLSIKINEVKFGILNITGKVFDELKKQEGEKLKVQRPYVYFTVK